MAKSTHPSEHRVDHRPIPERLVSGLSTIEDLVYLGVALVLVGVAVVALYETTRSLVTSHQPFAEAVTTAVNGVLFVVIVLEIFRTVLAHLEGGGFQLRPFLIIGVISVVRHILLVGAVSSTSGNTAFNQVQIELGVNAGVALVLVIALVLLHRSGATSDLEPVDGDDDQ